MQYISTRGEAATLNFEQATLTGLATDGGLYLPEKWPHFSEDEIKQLAQYDYPSLCHAIVSKFTGDSLSDEVLKNIIDRTYQCFHHRAIAPLKQLDSQLFLMELFHGPTLAFKDYALQFLGQLLQHFLQQNQQQCTIIGATSGDTGSAAIAAVRGIEAVNLFMFHPQDRVSEIQRKQMTTVLDCNVYNIALRGNFDDCQNAVKALFNDLAWRDQHNLTAVNSINWARIVAQVVYYFYAALALGAPHREINFSVPTGNFGNILAGYIAKQMGLPIKKLIIGSNKNDILTRFFENGTMATATVNATISPSMDIQISSNFERYLFELFNRDSTQLSQCMKQFSSEGKFTIDSKKLEQAKSLFSAYRFEDNEIITLMKQLYTSTGEIIDPHSTIGIAAAQQEQDKETPTVVLGTAHPAKFPDAIDSAIGVTAPLPEHVGNIMNAEEKCDIIDNSVEQIKFYIDKKLK